MTGKHTIPSPAGAKVDYGNDQPSQACTTDSFRVTLEIIYRFPKWERTDDAPFPLVDKWNSYMKNLVMHEKGHGDLAVEAASELCRAVYKMPPVLSCADLDRHVQSLVRELRDQLNADQRLYDATTDHGISQGAFF
jgi:predicted secreted Zn-dependent protease